jgi:hypothetical protein
LGFDSHGLVRIKQKNFPQSTLTGKGTAGSNEMADC